MIDQLLPFVTPFYIAIGGLVTLVLVQTWIRFNYARKVSAAGGVHAPKLAKDPFTGTG